jgi:hypothetical protein|tara:strand:+ start:106 stop:717 length:612 start_codon:yes stop_codon:yes gene_type:complete
MAITLNGSGTVSGISAGGLPDGIIQSADLATGVGGKILQVVNNEKTDTASTSGNSGNAGGTLSFTDTPGINVTITPIAASSKILVEFFLGKACHNGNSTLIRCTRSVAGGTATAIKNGTAEGSRPVGLTNITYKINNNHAESLYFRFVDSPSYSVGQAIVYQMQVNTETNNSFYVNRSISDDNEGYNYRARCFSCTTATEIAA